MATTNPPSAPSITAGPATVRSCVCMNWFHVHAAVAIAHSSRMPVLFTVPLSVMRAEASTRLPPYWLCAKLENVFWPSAGFEVLINAMGSLRGAKQIWGTARQCSRLTRRFHSKYSGRTSPYAPLQTSIERRQAVRALVPRHRRPQIFDRVHGLNAAARSLCHAVHRRRRAGEIQLPFQRPLLHQPVNESGAKDVASPGRICHRDAVRGAVHQLLAVPRQHAVLAQGRRAQPAAVAREHAAQSAL